MQNKELTLRTTQPLPSRGVPQKFDILYLKKHQIYRPTYGDRVGALLDNWVTKGITPSTDAAVSTTATASASTAASTDTRALCTSVEDIDVTTTRLDLEVVSLLILALQETSSKPTQLNALCFREATSMRGVDYETPDQVPTRTRVAVVKHVDLLSKVRTVHVKLILTVDATIRSHDFPPPPLELDQAIASRIAGDRGYGQENTARSDDEARCQKQKRDL